MRKFLSTLIIFFVLAFVLPKNVFAADVPSFLALDSANIALTNKFYDSNWHCTAYVYECSPSTAENFIKRFIARLMNTELFEISLAGRFNDDDIHEINEEIYFKYKGTKKVHQIDGVNFTKHNLKISRNLTSNIDFIVLIVVPDGLRYEDENVPVVPSTPTRPALRTQS